MIINKNVDIITNNENGDIEFNTNTNTSSSLICYVPCSIKANSSSSILLNTPLIINRNINNNSEFMLVINLIIMV